MKRRPFAVLAVTQLLAACGPELAPTWMLGVFTNVDGSPRGAPQFDDQGTWRQWTFYDDGVFEIARAWDGELMEPLLWTWEVLREDRVVLFPDDDTGVRETWWLTRHGECGPFVHQILFDGEVIKDAGEIYPGEICAEPVYCPDVGVDCTYRLEACPGTPPPCGDDE